MKKRSMQSEKLDNLSLEGEDLVYVFDSLAWINRWLGNTSSTVRQVLKLADQIPPPGQVRIIDLACGGGDIIRALVKKFEKKKRPYAIVGIDGNPNALRYCAAKSGSNPNISYLEADLLDENFLIEPCDLLISSHFIYHFSSTELAGFLLRNMPQVKKAVLFSELERNQWALSLFKIFGPLLPISPMAYQDGALAIRRAFTKAELTKILQSSGLKNYRVRRLPFFRLQVVISRRSAAGS